MSQLQYVPSNQAHEQPYGEVYRWWWTRFLENRFAEDPKWKQCKWKSERQYTTAWESQRYTCTKSIFQRQATQREADDEFDDESSPHKKPKKSLIKKTAATKHKAPKMAKSGSQQREASNLSFEEKAPASESEGDGSDDDDDGEYGTVVVEPKKKKVLKEANTKKLIKEKKKWLHGKGGVKPSLPPVEPPDVNKVKTKQRVTGDPSKTGAGMMNGRDESESSQTLSSPN
jgi:hypothetical protein